MQACDFRSSDMFFEVDHHKAITVTSKQPIPHNQVRIPLECRCEVTGPGGGTTHYVLTASCKTERVAVQQDVWLQPNADFCVVSSDEHFLILKRWQQCDISIERESSRMAAHIERQVGRGDDAWTSHRRNVDLVEARVLTSVEQIVAAVHGRRPLVSRTEFGLQDGGRCLIEYPVKTINVSDRELNYQVDTGPVLYPDPDVGHEQFIGNFRLAYIAHNCPDWAELIVNVPTPIEGGARVHHFSRPLRVDAKNAVIELTGAG